MAHKVYFRPNAEADLAALYEYIADHAGPEIAGRYLNRIEEACMRLSHFPERGTQRSDIMAGLRTIGFERRVTIAFRVLKTRVEIVAIAYAGRQFETDLGKPDEGA